MWNKQTLKQIMLRIYRDVRIHMAAAGLFAFVWWGFLYPELCFTENTYEQVSIVDGEAAEAEQTGYQGVLGASGHQIIVKSRLWEWLEQKINKE